MTRGLRTVTAGTSSHHTRGSRVDVGTWWRWGCQVLGRGQAALFGVRGEEDAVETVLERPLARSFLKLI